MAGGASLGRHWPFRFSGGLCYMAAMKLRHVAALALLILNAGIFALLLLLTFEAAAIRDSLRRNEHEDRPAPAPACWYLMMAPFPVSNARVSGMPTSIHPDTTAPLSQWMIRKTFPTQNECEGARMESGRSDIPSPKNPWERCVSTDDPSVKGPLFSAPWTPLVQPH